MVHMYNPSGTLKKSIIVVENSSTFLFNLAIHHIVPVYLKLIYEIQYFKHRFTNNLHFWCLQCPKTELFRRFSRGALSVQLIEYISHMFVAAHDTFASNTCQQSQAEL